LRLIRVSSTCVYLSARSAESFSYDLKQTSDVVDCQKLEKRLTN